MNALLLASLLFTCPQIVTAAASKAYPEAKITGCKEEQVDKKLQYEVKMTTKDAHRVTLDLSAAGALLQTEEDVAVGDTPTAIVTAFERKYGRAKIMRIEKMTKVDGTTLFELAFAKRGKRHEATFDSNGKLIEEE